MKRHSLDMLNRAQDAAKRWRHHPLDSLEYAFIVGWIVGRQAAQRDVRRKKKARRQ